MVGDGRGLPLLAEAREGWGSSICQCWVCTSRRGQLLEGLPLAGVADLPVCRKITSFKLRNGAALLDRVLQLPQHHLGTP